MLASRRPGGLGETVIQAAQFLKTPESVVLLHGNAIFFEKAELADFHQSLYAERVLPYKAKPRPPDVQ